MLTEFELLELENDFFTACSKLGWRYLAHRLLLFNVRLLHLNANPQPSSSLNKNPLTYPSGTINLLHFKNHQLPA
jgi:hypothetical protein